MKKKPARVERGPARKPTSVKLDEAVHKRALLYKVNTGRDLQDILSEALDEYLKKRGA